MKRRTFRASDLELVRPASAFVDGREPPLQIGNLVILNSGGPVGLVVGIEGDEIVVAWAPGEGDASEFQASRACFHRARFG